MRGEEGKEEMIKWDILFDVKWHDLIFTSFSYYCTQSHFFMMVYNCYNNSLLRNWKKIRFEIYDAISL